MLASEPLRWKTKPVARVLRAACEAGWGGALYTADISRVTATNCRMAHNSAGWGGAVYANEQSAVVATGCNFTANTAFSGQ